MGENEVNKEIAKLRSVVECHRKKVKLVEERNKTLVWELCKLRDEGEANDLRAEVERLTYELKQCGDTGYRLVGAYATECDKVDRLQAELEGVMHRNAQWAKELRAEIERLKKRLAYAEANEQADCEGTQQCQGCHDCRIDYAKDVRLEIDRLTRERDEAWVQLNMTRGEAENDYRQLERDKDAEIDRLTKELDTWTCRPFFPRG
jgi:hypothetical protein